MRNTDSISVSRKLAVEGSPIFQSFLKSQTQNYCHSEACRLITTIKLRLLKGQNTCQPSDTSRPLFVSTLYNSSEDD